MNQESPHYSLEQQLHSQPERMWQNKIFQISKKKDKLRNEQRNFNTYKHNMSFLKEEKKLLKFQETGL